LTVNTYRPAGRLAPDIVEGSQTTSRYSNYHPVIAEFVSDDNNLLERRKRAISPSEWHRAAELAAASLARPTVRIRDGRPLFSQNPVEPLDLQASG
jgi:hypothetical protein